MNNPTSTDTLTSERMPVIYVPHGGGPLPLLGEESHSELIIFLKNIAAQLPRPKSILVINAHWEERIAHVSA
jgi:aromatic ring-opening dioxygenase catalytic subunit (LigB family)